MCVCEFMQDARLCGVRLRAGVDVKAGDVRRDGSEFLVVKLGNDMGCDGNYFFGVDGACGESTNGGGRDEQREVIGTWLRESHEPLAEPDWDCPQRGLPGWRPLQPSSPRKNTI